MVTFPRTSMLLFAFAAFGPMANGSAAAAEASAKAVSSEGAIAPVLRFAQQLAGERMIRATIRHDGSDAYQFKVAGDKAVEVECGSERGVLYAVYDVLDGKSSGGETPAFAIRGLFPCDAAQRHTPEMMRRLIDRMGRWRMNTLVIITHYGYGEFADLIEQECAKRGIDVTHYLYYQLAFCQAVPRECYSVDAQGKPRPPKDRLENEDRLCASNSKALELYREGVRRYEREHGDQLRQIFATPDGLCYCQCVNCRRLGPVGQAMPFFRGFMEETNDRGLRRELLVYFQRYQLPEDMSLVRHTDAIMFDDHTRNPQWPLHDPDNMAGPDWAHKEIDPRSRDASRNRYLFDRLLEWRAAYQGQLYIHENLMIQGAYGVPRFNTRVYLEDLRQFQKAKIDGVVYEAFECGIRPFLPSFDVLSRALWNPSIEFAIHDDANPELHEFYRLVEKTYQENDWPSCRDLMIYLLGRPDREEFDWLFIGYDSMKRAYAQLPIADLTDEERELITTRKLWDYMEGRPNARQTVGRLIEQVAQKLSAMSVEQLRPAGPH